MYVWGTGRIGLGSFTDTREPTQLYFNTFNNGSDTDIEKDLEDSTIPKGDKSLEFIGFCAGRAHSLVVDNKNRCWTIGEYFTNEIPFNKYPILDKLVENYKFKKVYCWDRNYGIDEKGQVIQWGMAGIDDEYLVPRVLQFKYSIKEISCSYNNTVAISDCGKAFVNIFQSQGFKLKMVEWFQENKIEIVQVGCGVQHCLFLDSKGHVYSSGKGIQTGQFKDFGELDNQSDQEIVQQQDQEENLYYDSPKKIKELYNIVQIKCGYKHSLALDYYTKQVFAWGENLNGQLGMEGQEYVLEPTIIPLPIVEIQSIEAGAYHSGFITTKGKLIMVGGVLVENGNFRMNLSIGNGEGGVNTIQFKVNVEDEETKISDNIVISKPQSNLVNVKEKESNGQDIKEDQQDGDDDSENAILSKDEIAELQYHLNEFYTSKDFGAQYNPQFIQSLKNKVVNKISLGLFHTMATTNSKEIPSIPTLQELCIASISNILSKINTDSDFQEIYSIPLDLILKIDSYLTLERKHTDKSLRLIYHLKSSYERVVSIKSSKLSKPSTSDSSIIKSEWDEYLNYFEGYESVCFLSLESSSIISKSEKFEIPSNLIQDLIKGLNQENIEEFSNYIIKIPNFKEFKIISITNSKILALNKQFTLVIDKTNLLLVLVIFKRELLMTSYILKDLDSIVLNLKMHGY